MVLTMMIIKMPGTVILCPSTVVWCPYSMYTRRNDKKIFVLLHDWLHMTYYESKIIWSSWIAGTTHGLHASYLLRSFVRSLQVNTYHHSKLIILREYTRITIEYSLKNKCPRRWWWQWQPRMHLVDITINIKYYHCYNQHSSVVYK